ncbi:MAG: hypothetical protein FWC32_12990 [Firmicutes bacterium]|nr:hypothetical protein [Bacillota bacterium]
MSTFALNFDPMNGITRTLGIAATNLSNGSNQLHVQANRLAGQSGFGISQLQTIINGLGRNANRLSDDISLIAGFVTTLESSTRTHEKMAFQELSGMLVSVANVDTDDTHFSASWLSGGRDFGNGWSTHWGIGNVAYGRTSRSVFADLSLLSVGAYFNYGVFSANGNIHVGRVQADASFNFFEWVEEYKWDPETGKMVRVAGFDVFNAGASVSASAISGNVNINAGDDMLGASVGATGSVAGASAYARINVGMNDSREINAYARVGAIAYVASGRITSGFDILGIRINGHVGGYVKGVGARGRFGFYDGAFVIEGSVAAYLGINGGISIGFNDAGWQEVTNRASDAFNTTQQFFNGLFGRNA